MAQFLLGKMEPRLEEYFILHCETKRESQVATLMFEVCSADSQTKEQFLYLLLKEPRGGL